MIKLLQKLFCQNRKHRKTCPSTVHPESTSGKSSDRSIVLKSGCFCPACGSEMFINILDLKQYGLAEEAADSRFTATVYCEEKGCIGKWRTKNLFSPTREGIDKEVNKAIRQYQRWQNVLKTTPWEWECESDG